MARIKIDYIIDYLNKDIRKALEETLKQYFPNESFDNRALFHTFKRNVAKKCSSWEEVPDHLIVLEKEKEFEF
ncbi:MAG TPA: hypothetical protein PKK00_05110 [Bacteroidales bacterium]|nr:hypothetical protein [Bacteroidales bacterium]HPS16738.1 hypothetical protein [Bacteroidales bacterium]